MSYSPVVGHVGVISSCVDRNLVNRSIFSIMPSVTFVMHLETEYCDNFRFQLSPITCWYEPIILVKQNFHMHVTSQGFKHLDLTQNYVHLHV